MKKEKRVKREKTGFICDFEYFMKNSCEKCRLSRLCEEYERGVEMNEEMLEKIKGAISKNKKVEEITGELNINRYEDRNKRKDRQLERVYKQREVKQVLGEQNKAKRKRACKDANNRNEVHREVSD